MSRTSWSVSEAEEACERISLMLPQTAAVRATSVPKHRARTAEKSSINLRFGAILLRESIPAW